jgi:hypothetical protein
LYGTVDGLLCTNVQVKTKPRSNKRERVEKTGFDRLAKERALNKATLRATGESKVKGVVQNTSHKDRRAQQKGVTAKARGDKKSQG